LAASLDKEAAKRREINAIIADYNRIAVADPSDPRLYDGSQEKLLAAVEAKYKPAAKPKGPKGDDPDAAARRAPENLPRQVVLLAELEDGHSRVSEAARIRYEIEEGAFKSASPALKQQLIDYSQLYDSEQRRIEAAKQMVQVHLELARLQGKPVPAELDESAQ